MGRSMSTRLTGCRADDSVMPYGGDDNVSAVRVVVLQAAAREAAAAAKAAMVGQVDELTRQRDQYKAERDQDSAQLDHYSAQLDQYSAQLVCHRRGVRFLRLSRPTKARKGRICLVLLSAF